MIQLKTTEEIVKWTLRNHKEDQRTEIKRSIELINVRGDEIEKDSVAVANSCPPEPSGWIIFGIDDRSFDVLGAVDLRGTSQLSDDVVETRRQQYSQIAARVIPPLSFEWCDFLYSNKRLIVVKIGSRSSGHWYQTSNGGIFYRLDGHTYPADEHLIAKWIQERTEVGSKSGINDLLVRLHSRKIPLSQCFVEAMKIASDVGDHKLDSFCRNELNGWDEDELQKESSSYRTC